MPAPRPAARLPLLAAAVLLACAPVPTRAQDAPPYRHPLFEGPVYRAPAAPYDAEALRLALLLGGGDALLGDARYRLRLTDETATLSFLAAGAVVDSVLAGAGAGTPVAFAQRGDTLFVDVVAAAPDTALDPAPADSLAAEADATAAADPPAIVGIDTTAVDTTAVDTTAAGVFAPGDVLDLRVVFRSAADAVVRGGDGAAWTPPLRGPGLLFPAPIDPADVFSAELLLSHPDGLVLTAPGEIVADAAAEGWRTVQLRLDRPISAADVVFAALPPDAPGPPPADAALGYLATYLRTPFPWPAARIAAVPGAPDAPHAATAGGGALLLARRALVDDADRALAGGLARAWFGGRVGAVDPREAWWEDAAATYLAARYAAEASGEPPGDALDLALLDLADRYVAEAATYRRPLVWDVFEHPAQLRDAHAAAKGAWVLHMLRGLMGDDAFREALATFLDEAAPRAGTEALEAAFARAAGRDLAPFFDAWVYSAGHPVLDVETTFLPDDEALRLDVRQVQDGYLVPGTFPLPLTVEVHTLFGERRFDLRMTGREESFVLDVPMAPRFVVVDPDDVLLADVRTDQDAAAWVAQARYAPQSTARLRAARALAAFRDEPALLVGLTNAFRSEAHPAVRAALARTIGTLPFTPSVEGALVAAADDPDPAVRAAAVAALGRADASPAAAARVRTAAETDDDLSVVAEAVRSLGAMGAPGAGDIVQAALVTPSPRERVRTAAFEALPGTDLPGAERLALALPYADPQHAPDVHAAALRYLAGHHPGDDATPARLRAALDDVHPDVRAAAVAGLLALGTEEARTAVEAHLADEPDPLLRTAFRAAAAR